MSKKTYKTLSVYVEDRHYKKLNRMANEVNYVWNYINDLSYRHIRDNRPVLDEDGNILYGRNFLSAFSMQQYLSGSTKYFELHSKSFMEIAKEYVTRRKQFKKNKLKWRTSKGSKKSLGWIPLNSQSIKWKFGKVYHGGTYYTINDTWGLGDYKWRSGCFTQDTKGRWFFNVVVEVEAEKEVTKGKGMVGIDLGLKSPATDSNGDGIFDKPFRELEKELRLAQQRRQKKRVTNIHKKIANKRKEAIHQYTNKLVKENAAIFVGDVNVQFLLKNKRSSKSVLDSAWGMVKSTLEYKCAKAGVHFEIVDEKYTTQTCSSCGKISDNSPKGRAGLRIREWTCECGVTHDRDVNAAKNILAVGNGRLAEENQKKQKGKSATV